MTIFNEIKHEIMADPMNALYTKNGILPLFKASKDAKIAIVGQAPGRKAEETQLFWNDLSGDRLRDWMGVSCEEFYETDRIAHLPIEWVKRYDDKFLIQTKTDSYYIWISKYKEFDELFSSYKNELP